MIDLIKGDCLEELKKIEERTVDCFICDLPYGTTTCKWDKKIDLDMLWKELKRIAKNDNTPYFFFCDMRLAVELINSNPKMFRYDLVIHKTRCVGFLNSNRMPMRGHELLLVFYKKCPVYNKDKYHKKIKKYNQGGDYGIYGKITNRDKTLYDNTLPTSIIKMTNNNKAKRFHKTQKELDILEWIVKYYTNENDVVLDPTMGSGSTGVACVSLNRKFIGIELDDTYYEVAEKRLLYNDNVNAS
jgi:site-specific DNA-methyltransferase (adenine-specific)